MELTKQQAREQAWHEFLNKRNVAREYHNGAIGQDRFVAGFDAGVQFARGQWKEIRSAEDLPTVAGQYWVAELVAKGTKTIVEEYEWFLNSWGYRDDGNFRRCTPNAIAYMKIERPAPYQPAEEKTAND